LAFTGPRGKEIAHPEIGHPEEAEGKRKRERGKRERARDEMKDGGPGRSKGREDKWGARGSLEKVTLAHREAVH